jgi:DNA-binding beta-propeller fold protein YncE
MRRSNFSITAVSLPLLFSLFALTALGQSPGYITSGGSGIQPFDPASATLLGFLHVPNVGGVAAVSADGSQIYVALANKSSTKGAMVLGTVDASTGEVVSKVQGIGYAETFLASKVLLSPDGSTAYAMCDDIDRGPSLVGIVDLASGSVVGYVYADGGELGDIALSPDGTRLFVSAAAKGFGPPVSQAGRPQPAAPVYDCVGSNTVCAFDTGTFALAGQVSGLSGNLSVSQDGSSLYVVTVANLIGLYAVNTSTFAQSQIPVPDFFPRVLAVAPAGNQAVAVGSTTTSTFAELLLDTQSNTVVGSLPTPPAPSGAEAGTGSNISAFSPDGSSLWTVLCTGESCTQMIVGQRFPSGDLIGEATLPTVQGFIGISF